MKLSELVAYKTGLEHYDFIRSSRGLIKKINESQSDIARSNHINDDAIRFGQDTYSEQIANDLDSLERQIESLNDNYVYYKNQIDQLILEHEVEYIKHDEENISQTLGEGIKDLTDRQLRMSAKQKREFISRINLYAEWRWPALIIRPENQDMVEAMCAFDPLYICDLYDDLIQPYVKKFNQVYQNRLRPYTIKPFAPKQKSLDVLPQGQFGFIVAYNLFEHYPLSMVKQMLQEIEKLLKPGGTLLFTFNNCDLSRNIRTIEMGLRCYTPYRLLKPILDQIGFRVVKLETEGDNWLEIKKPGTLRTVRGGQTIGKVWDSKAKRLKAEADAKARQEASEEGVKKAKEQRRQEEILFKKLQKTLGERVPWSASNKGYAKGQHVRFHGKNYVALVNVLPKQKFEQGEWELVE